MKTLVLVAAVGASAVLFVANSSFAGAQNGQKSVADLQTESLGRIKSYSTGIIMYSLDYDDSYPYVNSNKTLQRVVEPYIKRKEVFNTLNPSKPGIFLYNISLGGLVASQIEDHEKTPLLYDPTAWPDGKYIVAYTLGSARAESADTWKKLQPLLKLKLPRSGKPIKP